MRPVKDFLVTTSAIPFDIDGRLEQWRGKEQPGSRHILTVYSPDNDWETGNASDNTHLLCGRPWPLSAVLHEQPDFSVSSINSWSSNIHGGWCLIRIQDDQIQFATDPLGAIPLYFARNASGISISTREDWCLISLRQEPSLDILSLTEIFQGSGITYPNCLFEEVKQLEHGSLLSLNIDGQLRSERWFDPTQLAIPKSPLQVLKDARSAFEKTIDETTRDVKRFAILLSGGADSRAVAGCVHDLGRSENAVAFHLQATQSMEHHLADSLAKAYGISIRKIDNSARGYLFHLRSNRFHGGAPVFVHSHLCGLEDDIQSVIGQGAPIVCGGLYGDMFKGNPYSKRVRQALVRIKGDRFSRSPIKYDLRASASERKAAYRKYIAKTFGVTNARRWTEYWPITRHPAHGNYLLARQMFYQIEPYLTQGVFWPLISLPERYRHGRLLSELTFSRYYRHARDIPTDHGMHLGSGISKYIYSAIRPKKALQDTANAIANFRSWPDRTGVFREELLTRGSELVGEISPQVFCKQSTKNVIDRLPMRAMGILLQAQQVSEQIQSGLVTSFFRENQSS